MPSFEKVKSQKLEQSDFDIMTKLFDEAFLEEGDLPFKGLETDYPKSIIIIIIIIIISP